MKKIVFLVLMLLLPLGFVKAAGSIKVSTTSVTIEPGKSKTIKITASNAAGRVDISTSNSAVASISSSSQFLDNSSASIKITGKSEGTATVTVKVTDAATYDGKVLNGQTMTVKVTVKKTEPKAPVIKEMKINKIEVVGYDIGFKPDTYEYTLDIPDYLSKVYVTTSGENAKVAGYGEINIVDRDSIKITFTNTTKSDDVKEYVIKFNKKAEQEPEVITKEVVKEIVVEKPVEKDDNKVSRVYLFTTIGLGVLCLVLLLLLFKKNKDKELSVAVAGEEVISLPKPVDSVKVETPPSVPETPKVEEASIDVPESTDKTNTL